MIYHRIQTIRNQIHELEPDQAMQLEKSGQMEVILWEYQEQMIEAATQAAMAYKKAALKENPKTNMEVIIQGQEMTSRAAEEIEQAQIMEELNYMYGQDSYETTDTDSLSGNVVIETPNNPNNSSIDKNTLPKAQYEVVIADNFHYMDETEYSIQGTYHTETDAIKACKQIVDKYLHHAYKPGMTAEELYNNYTSFGDDPFIRGNTSGKSVFSAWEYAKARCATILEATQK